MPEEEQVLRTAASEVLCSIRKYRTRKEKGTNTLPRTKCPKKHEDCRYAVEPTSFLSRGQIASFRKELGEPMLLPPSWEIKTNHGGRDKKWKSNLPYTNSGITLQDSSLGQEIYVFACNIALECTPYINARYGVLSCNGSALHGSFLALA